MFKELSEKLESGNAVVCVVGAGYVGLPLSVAFARAGLKTIAFDMDKEKINMLLNAIDTSGEIGNDMLKETIDNFSLHFTSSADEISKADFVIICVPTPVTKDKKPDLSYVEGAAKTVGQNLKQGAVIVLESTVYPGVTEEVLKPIIEKESGMLCGRDFSIGYSPERVNPGDREHKLENVVKVVSGIDSDTADVLEKLYSMIVKAGVFKAKDIKTAEAAKVIENIQRDLNIALVNELAIIFRRLGLDSKEVLEAAATKWNFHKYYPGLVGGHCIPVDPYYLVHKARETGYDPKVILAGREINDYMPEYVANIALEELRKAGKNPRESRILLVGLSFKKNVKDIRNAPVKGIIKILNDAGTDIVAYEPLLDNGYIEKNFGIKTIKNLNDATDVNCSIIIVDHDVFRQNNLDEKLRGICLPGSIIIDVRRMLDSEKIEKHGFIYRGI